MKNVLIIEDDISLNKGIAMALKSEDISLHSCFSLQEAAALLAENQYRLIVLDLNLPDGNGLDFLQQLRKKNRIPVILLTANDLELDIVNGLNAGADDYITKPFSLAVLRARVQVQLRRDFSDQLIFEKATDIFREEPYYFDFQKFVFRGPSGVVDLSKTEQKLLRILLENRDTVLSRERLLEWVWNDGASFVDENALSVAVKRLRDKLDAGERIKTIYGIGYSWVSQ